MCKEEFDTAKADFEEAANEAENLLPCDDDDTSGSFSVMPALLVFSLSSFPTSSFKKFVSCSDIFELKILKLIQPGN
jgi:hypothetical protein